MGCEMLTIQKTQEGSSFSGVLKSLDTECRSCSPITPFECITRCKVYKLKNEFWHLRENMLNNQDYIKDLFNALKNETRLYILGTLVNGTYSLGQLQLELKKSGCSHSQGALCEEYLHPLTSLGVVSESRGEYRLTMFGSRLTKHLCGFTEFSQSLPANSEGCEEAVLQHLLSGEKTFKEIEAVIMQRNVSRTLKRLRSARLIKTPTEREYIFFFKTKRDPNGEALTATERKIHAALSPEGLSAGKLASQSGFSLRVTYKCLKRLRGKKLVFLRRTLKTYHLTGKGETLAAVLQELQQIVDEAWVSFQQVSQDKAGRIKVGIISDNALMR